MLARDRNALDELLLDPFLVRVFIITDNYRQNVLGVLNALCEQPLDPGLLVVTESGFPGIENTMC